MRRRNVPKEGQNEVPVYADCEGTRSFPNLTAFLRDQTYDDGSARETGTILLFVEDGRYKVWLHDRDAGESCFVSNTTLSNLLHAVEAGLKGDDLEWRAGRNGVERKKR
jgi:hypothetical protein